MKRTNSGFTAIELLVTVTIAAILVSLAVPSFREMIQTNQLAATSNELTYALSRARSEALKLGRSVVVCASSNPNDAAPLCGNVWSDGWIVFADEDGDVDYDAGEKLMLVRGQLGPTYVVAATANVLNGVVFRPQGIVAGTFGNFQITDTAYVTSDRLVCVSITGKSRTLRNKPSSGCTCQTAENCQ